MREKLSSCCVALAVIVFSVAAGAQGSEQVVVPADSADLPALARALPLGGQLRIEGVRLEPGGVSSALELTRFRVFAPSAKVVVRGSEGEAVLPAPENAYFRGLVEGDPDSLAFLTVRAVGGMRGLIASRGRYWVMGGGGGAGGPDVGLAVREIDVEIEFADEIARWVCSTDELRDVSSVLEEVFRPALAPESGISRAPGASYTARVAVETDFEFYLLFGSTVDATDYIGDIIGYGSVMYDTEVDTSWEIETIYLYTTAADPWNETSSLCALFEFGRYWNDNHSDIDRTIVHMMSGKSSGGGVAWTPALCSDPFNYDHQGACPNLVPSNDNYGGDYGYSGAMSGSFDISNPTAVWDIYVVTHEIGHNFNSPHTHCYIGIGGPNPVDPCYNLDCSSSCYCGSVSLPAGCPGPGQGCGTIMSYCHLLGGGQSNIALSLGTGHPYGIDPIRVPNRMNDFVVTTAAGNPACLAFVDPNSIFADGFESGDMSAWSLAVP